MTGEVTSTDQFCLKGMTVVPSGLDLRFDQEQRVQAWKFMLPALGQRERQQRNELRMRDALIAEQRRRSARRTVPAPVLTPLEQRMEKAFDRLLDQELNL